MSRTESARCLKELLIRCSPLMEVYTRQVCSQCTDVCCRQKHGLLRKTDRAYLSALGEPVTCHKPGRDPDGPCEHLGPEGCARPRWQRAWKCTWYFCAPLLRALDEGPQKQARELQALLAEMGRLYDMLEGE
jgi:hypothetical protein